MATATTDWQALKLQELISQEDDELAGVDLAAVNLACARDLPGAEDLDIDQLLLKLDEWTNEVRHQIQRSWYRFLESPKSFENSPGYFQILVLITTLQRDLGMRYNPARVNDPNFQDPYSVNPDFRDSKDLFIHGILDGPGGTCASMPVVYAAVCRRLGMPVSLVEAKDHLYCRWDDVQGRNFPRERFNIEGSSKGFSSSDDSFYETWPRPLTEFDRDCGAYGKCLSPRQELAAFINSRGHCLLDNGRRPEALECFQWTVDLVPEDKRYKMQLSHILSPPQGRYHIPSPAPMMVGKTGKSQSRPVEFMSGSMNLPMPNGHPYGTVSPKFVPEPGRTYKVAYGRPLPSCLPFGTPMEFVPVGQEDNFAALESAANQPPWGQQPSKWPHHPMPGQHPGMTGPGFGHHPHALGLPGY